MIFIFKNSIHFAISIVIAIVIKAAPAKAQSSINLVRYNDNFSFLKKDTLKRGLDRLKYISLGKENYISFGGELREQWQFFRNTNFGDIPSSFKSSTPSQLNHRLMLHASIEHGSRLRFFVQLNNTLRFLNDNPPVPEIDENQLSLHQAFAEFKFSKWEIRAGRQELLYGNHRLITVREGPNTRKNFDGIVIKRKFYNGSIDIIATSPTISKQLVFDDISFKESIIGIYGTRNFVSSKIGIDYFALHFHSKLRRYNYNAGVENRQTYGMRLYSNFRKINFEVEGAYQMGRFNDLNIKAYNFIADVNVLWLPSKKGIIGFAANAASGDKNWKDDKLNTYNLLYAKPAYGLAVPIGSTNIISLYPYIKINPVHRINVLAQVFFLSRNSDQDGTYSPGMIENRPKPDILFSSNKRALGVFYVLETSYMLSKNISFFLDASYFKAGPYPKATGKGENITYLSFKTTFRF